MIFQGYIEIRQCFEKKYKVRLVEKRLNQVEVIDYKETFSPVVKSQIIHLVLALTLLNVDQSSN